MRAVITAIFSFGLVSTGWAQSMISSPAAEQSWLTIYPDDLAMITERRVVNVPSGASTIRFLGVSDQIVPETSVLQSFEGLTLESNFDGDLITRGALLDRAVGQTLKVRITNIETGQISLRSGRLISAANVNEVVQGIVLETAEGVEALECAGLADALIFNGLPDGLNAEPVLSMDVIAVEGGEKEIYLSYLSRGIGWQADYRLDVGPEEKGQGALQGWLTVTNDTAKSFKDTPTAIIAGKLNIDDDTQPDVKKQKTFIPGCWPQGSTKSGIPNGPVLYSHNTDTAQPRMMRAWDGSSYAEGAPPPPPRPMAYAVEDEIIVTATKRSATLEDFQDYKLYRTPQPVTVAAMQTKQISFVDIENAEFERLYKFDLSLPSNSIPYEQPQRMIVEYQINNDKDGNLGKPLPKGKMRVMTRRENGKTAYLGETRIRDLAVDLPVEIPVSESAAVLLMTEKSVQAKGPNMVANFTGIISNATPNTITSELELTSDVMRYEHISQDNQPRKADSVLPTYVMKVAPESYERLSLSVPVTERSFFEHNYVNYLDGPKFKNYKREIARREYYLKGEEGALSWGRDLVAGSSIPPLKMTAEISNWTKEESDFGIEVTEFEEDITISNPSDQKRTIRFRIERGQQINLVDASRKPDKGQNLQWTLAIPAKGQRILTITTKGYHGITPISDP